MRNEYSKIDIGLKHYRSFLIFFDTALAVRNFALRTLKGISLLLISFYNIDVTFLLIMEIFFIIIIILHLNL